MSIVQQSPIPSLFAIITVASLAPLLRGQTASDRIDELDEYWAVAAETVRKGDFEGYRKTFHLDAVLVSEIAGTSYPIARAFERWKEGFEDTKHGKIKANVEFRFSKRIGDGNSARNGHLSLQHNRSKWQSDMGNHPLPSVAGEKRRTVASRYGTAQIAGHKRRVACARKEEVHFAVILGSDSERRM